MDLEREFVDKKLHTILEDAAFFMEESRAINFEETDSPREREEKSTRGHAFARASILNSAFLLEATANCCISTLELSDNLYSDVERMRTLSKFEYYLRALNTGKDIDRGLLVTQKAKELISQRNSYVHPKHYQSKWEKVDDRSAKVSLGETQYLKLPKSLWRCKHKHAEISLKAAIDFISYFFRDLCKLNEHQVREIAFGSEDPQQPQKWIKLHYAINADVCFLVNVAEVEEGEKRFREHLEMQERAKKSEVNKNA